VVRTPGFHPGNRGSIPRRGTKKYIMANHKSALKRIRQSEKRRLLNKYQHKTARNAVKSLKSIKKKKEALGLFPKVVAMLDKLAKRNIIHRNKASNLKGKLAQHINSL
jgi:small subunit ribosomal protein S20